MRIEYLQISNIMSFKFHSDIGNAEKISFDHGLNIIIGENGAGKSTALEVINFLFRRVIYRQYNFNSDSFEKRRSITVNDRRQVLIPVNQSDYQGFRLDPNWDSETSPQRIRIAIRLDEIDRENIQTIKSSLSILSQTIAHFSVHTISDGSFNDGLYTIDVTLNRVNNTFSVEKLPNGADFGFTYLIDYNFFKELILMHNVIQPDDPINQLFESFTLISSYRNYHSFQPSISLSNAPAAHQIYQIRSQDYSRSLNASDNGEPSIFGLVRLQVAQRHFGLMSGPNSESDADIKANDLPLIRAINQRLSVVNLRCEIKLFDLRTWQYSFYFYDIRRNRSIGDINSLSAGQKAILHLVLEAYGRGDLKGGVVIIDEPEIHLHYQFQHEYLQVLSDLNRSQNCQYILVTHSEALINSNTINSVRRFALDGDGNTSIFVPEIQNDQKSLIKILDNSRSTYAFFSKKVVLVEGETDRYFIRAIIQDYYRSLEQQITVLHISGKGEFSKWRSLFTDFGLTVFAIADLDYIINLHYPAEKSVSLKKPQAIIDFKQRNPDWETRIDEEAIRGNFILKEGDLETYLGVRKDLGEVISFCRDNMSAFLADDSSSKSLEIRRIIERITQ